MASSMSQMQERIWEGAASPRPRHSGFLLRPLRGPCIAMARSLARQCRVWSDWSRPSWGSRGEMPLHHVACPLPRCKGFYMVKDPFGVYRLNREHNYYFQLLGQMALSGLSWGDFVVYTKHFLIVERIPFCRSEWVICKNVLDKFYFETLLPYLVQE